MDTELERQDALDEPDHFSNFAEGHHNEEQERYRIHRHHDASLQVRELAKANPKKVAHRLATMQLDYQTHAQTPILRDIAYTQVIALQKTRP